MLLKAVQLPHALVLSVVSLFLRLRLVFPALWLSSGDGTGANNSVWSPIRHTDLLTIAPCFSLLMMLAASPLVNLERSGTRPFFPPLANRDATNFL